MELDYLIDKINIKTLPELISGYMHENLIKKYYNLRSFYSILLSTINEDIKNSYLNRILKYLSSDKESNIGIIDDFNENVYDDALALFSKNLCDEINKTNDSEILYEKLNRNVNRMYFDYKEYVDIKDSHNNKEYSKFLFLLLKHAFSRYKYNTPCITGKRLYDEALSMYYDSDTRKEYLRLSAELGNLDGILLHTAHIYRSNVDEAILYHLKIKTNPSSLWQIAFAIENKYITKTTIEIVKKELGSVLIDDDFTKKFSEGSKCNNENMLLAFKIYNYCINKYQFTKAINSIGKLLINDLLSYKNDRAESIELAKQYFNRAIKLGNISAIINIAIYYYNHPDDKDYDAYIIKKYFKIASDFGDTTCKRYYGEILLKEGKKEEALDIFKEAASKNESHSCYHLGKYYEMNNEYPKAIDYYKLAINNKYYDAVYDLANLYYLLENLYNDSAYIGMASSLVNYYYDMLSDEIKKKVSKFLE